MARAGTSSDAPTTSGLKSSVPDSVKNGTVVPRNPKPVYDVQYAMRRRASAALFVAQIVPGCSVNCRKSTP